jgi:hypothetical protein
MCKRNLSRRGAIGALAATAASAAMSSATGAPHTAPALDPVKDMMTILKKLHLRMDDGAYFWWLVGTKVGQVDAAVTPLFNMEIGTIARVAHQPDGGYDVTTLEVVFYTDLDSGAQLRKWTNPYTGATLDVNHGPLGPGTVSYGPDGSRRSARREMGGAIIEGSTRVGPAVVVGNDAWLRLDNTSKVTQKDGSGRPFLVNDWLIFHGSAAEVADPSRPFVSATSQLQEINGWSRWMNMGDRAGNIASRAVGAKVRTYAEMPAKWRGLMAESYPEIARNPLAALDKPAARLDR